MLDCCFQKLPVEAADGNFLIYRYTYIIVVSVSPRWSVRSPLNFVCTISAQVGTE